MCFAVHLPFDAVNNRLVLYELWRECVCARTCVSVCVKKNIQHLLFAKLIFWVAVQ